MDGEYIPQRAAPASVAQINAQVRQASAELAEVDTPPADPNACATCRGEGIVDCPKCHDDDSTSVPRCVICQDHGHIWCAACGGKGVQQDG